MLKACSVKKEGTNATTSNECKCSNSDSLSMHYCKTFCSVAMNLCCWYSIILVSNQWQVGNIFDDQVIHTATSNVLTFHKCQYCIRVKARALSVQTHCESQALGVIPAFWMFSWKNPDIVSLIADSCEALLERNTAAKLPACSKLNFTSGGHAPVLNTPVKPLASFVEGLFPCLICKPHTVT